MSRKKRTVNTVAVRLDPADDALIAQVFLHPITQSAGTVQAYNQSKGLDLAALTAELMKQTTAVSGGDLTRPEAMLLTQAHALDAIFNFLAQRAERHEHLLQFETLLRLALKAQAQCVRTIEVLAAIKNPPVVYARQANISNGPQQVNNGVPSQVREIENKQNKLLEVQHGERMDTTKTGEAIGTYPQLETVESVNRAAVTGREGESQSQLLQGGDPRNASLSR